jgi:predicted dehydrogenase
METEDTAAAIFELDNGALGTIEGATSVWPSSAVSLEVRGFEGTITMKDGVIEKWILDDAEEGEEERMKSLPEYEDPGDRVEGFEDLGWWKGHALQIADFVDAINGDADAPIPGSEGRDAVEIIRAIYLSSKKGQRVELPLEKDF